MLYSKRGDLEDRIVELAAGGGRTLKSLHQDLTKGEALTLRAVYKAVTKLIAAGVLLKVGKRVMIDQEWADRVAQKLSAPALPALSNNERLSYTFVSMEHLDSFWKTIALPLERSTLLKEVFFYNPHNFWAYLPDRKESEDAYYLHFLEADSYGFFTVGGNSPADSEFKREYQSERLQIDLRDLPLFRRTDHITIVGSQIITVRLSKAVAERLDALYASGRGIGEILPEIIRVCRHPGKIKLSVENNLAKAETLKKALARNFYFKLSP